MLDCLKYSALYLQLGRLEEVWSSSSSGVSWGHVARQVLEETHQHIPTHTHTHTPHPRTRTHPPTPPHRHTHAHAHPHTKEERSNFWWPAQRWKCQFAGCSPLLSSRPPSSDSPLRSSRQNVPARRLPTPPERTQDSSGPSGSRDLQTCQTHYQCVGESTVSRDARSEPLRSWNKLLTVLWVL